MQTLPTKKSFVRHAGRARPRWQRLANYWLWRLAKREEEPEALARGIAVGMFAGLLPMLGQSFVAIALAWAVGGSRIVAAAMTFVSNPLTTFPIFVFDYWVGCQLLSKEMLHVSPSDFESWEKFSALGLDFVLTIFAGGLLVGGLSGVIAYFAGHSIVKKLQARRHQKRPARPKADLPKSA